MNFDFFTVPDISFGAGSSARLGELADKYGMRHAFLVTDPGIVKLGLAESGLGSLQTHGIDTTLYTEVQADPPEDQVLEAARRARAAGCDGVIGFGGGSSLDTAKLVAVLLGGDQPLSAMYGVDQVHNQRLPLLQVPTTAGTGSEVTAVAVVTTDETTKAGVVSPRLLADAVLLDPELTVGLPPSITAATGIDAMVHAIEAYTSAQRKNPLSDMLAIQALRLLAPNISTAVHHGENLEVRGHMLLGAMLAGQAFANAPVAAVHALAYPLGGIYHVSHGLSNSLVLPHVLRFNAPAAGHYYQEIAPLILGDEPIPANPVDCSQRLAEYFLVLADDLGLPTRLSELQIKEENLADLADAAMLQQRLLVNNPRPVEYSDALAIYRQAL